MWRFHITADIQIVLHMSANISYKSHYMKLLMLRNHDCESISGCSKYNSGFARKAWACTLSNGHCTVWSGLSSPELGFSMHYLPPDQMLDLSGWHPGSAEVFLSPGKIPTHYFSSTVSFFVLHLFIYNTLSLPAVFNHLLWFSITISLFLP